MSKVRNDLKICESGGIGRRARLRGVWLCHTGSIPVSRTKIKRGEISPRFYFATKQGISPVSKLCFELGSHFRPRRSLLASVSWAEIARKASLPVSAVNFSWCEKRTSNPLKRSRLNRVRISAERRSFCSQGDGSAEIVHKVNLPVYTVTFLQAHRACFFYFARNTESHPSQSFALNWVRISPRRQRVAR